MWTNEVHEQRMQASLQREVKRRRAARYHTQLPVADTSSAALGVVTALAAITLTALNHSRLGRKSAVSRALRWLRSRLLRSDAAVDATPSKGASTGKGARHVDARRADASRPASSGGAANDEASSSRAPGPSKKKKGKKGRKK
eukprot:TRINITY_DN4485_c1_g1_i1.p1 TRINITY_DN4485_c1_g1~~TRINITY_DN4485_c1_g1_i1.p1  ORF type:complete len:143 (-),score=14.91 TRINITY_DN4485_c1_g1_i1:492-920(-)